MSVPADLPVRPAEPGDLDGLLRIESLVFPGDRLSRRNFRHAIGSPSIVALVVGDPGEPAGYVLVETRRNARVAHLSSIAVAPAAAGSGLGRRLASAAEAEAARRGCDRIRLAVRADNPRAIELYERAGFLRIGREPRYYEDGKAALKFEKSLA